MFEQQSLFTSDEKKTPLPTLSSSMLPTSKPSHSKATFVSALEKHKIQEEAMLWIRSWIYQDMRSLDKNSSTNSFQRALRCEISIKEGRYPIDLIVMNELFARAK
jgi:hypothetical protein